jgi:hypothetical protein
VTVTSHWANIHGWFHFVTTSKFGMFCHSPPASLALFTALRAFTHRPPNDLRSIFSPTVTLASHNHKLLEGLR